MGRKFTFFKFLCSGIAVILLMPFQVNAQISMGKFLTSYSQNFNNFPPSGTATWEDGTYYMPGWTVKRTITNSVITANNGSGNTGGLISYGANSSTDRALGSISSTKAGEFAYGLLLQNNSGTAITSLDISFWGEQWRIANSTAGEHRIIFSYAISNDPLSFNLTPSNKNWTTVSELEFRSPKYFLTGGALDGNLADNRRYLTSRLPVSIPNGSYIMLRWVDYDEIEADHGLAIDDFSMAWNTAATSSPTILPVELAKFTAKSTSEGVLLNWLTASEIQNDYFAIERSPDGAVFEQVAKVKGNGTKHNSTVYTYTDHTPITGTSYYRLKQVDEDGSYTYSAIVSVLINSENTTFLVFPTVVTDQLFVSLPVRKDYLVEVYDTKGKIVLSQQVQPLAEFRLDVSRLNSGNYILRLQDEQGGFKSSKFLKR
ncbi:T9SS type A sorting domain-containing protein [Pontibacter vulgaris]|uniref:T9SS type A sorting domain-containing protein n=1 Tax=Pontibacter vulgaris TaxID=2905679 RepID=UPI001FA754F4|nr:T9SS type A sorting domain-containing protein [Pontibacter vulgaris]